MMRKWALGGALLGLIAAAVVFAPAQWLASGLAAASGGRVLLQAPRGTVWKGSAQLVLSGGEGSAGAVQLPSALNWTLVPTWLGVRITLDAGSSPLTSSPLTSSPFTLTATLKDTATIHWTLATAQFNLPAELLAGLGAPWNSLQLAGTLTLKSPQPHHLAGIWSRDQGFQPLAGQATLDATGVQTALSTVRPLGSYRAVITGATLQLTTPDAGDALQLSGTGTLVNTPAGRAQFVGEAAAAPGREAALANLLHIIGQRQSSTDGRVRSTIRLG